MESNAITHKIGKRIFFTKKTFIREYYLYLTFFLLVSLYYVIGGKAVLTTNDDWMLQNLLLAKGEYGTLIMSYPLSFLLSKLYDLSPSIQWYSLFLSILMGFIAYAMAVYIQSVNTILHKSLLFILFFFVLSYLWFHMSITSLSVMIVLIAIGTSRKNLILSYFLIFMASLLRSDLVLFLLPIYLLGIVILKNRIIFEKKSFLSFGILLFFLMLNIFSSKLDSNYEKWLHFNAARAASVDFQHIDPNNILSNNEKILLSAGWIQDEELLPQKKIIEAKPPLYKIVLEKIKHFRSNYFLKHHLNYWFYLLFLVSIVIIILYRKYLTAVWFALSMLYILSIIIVRDVDRVTIPLIFISVFIIAELLQKYQKLLWGFLALFTLTFAYYSYPGFNNKQKNLIDSLKNEARQLIVKSGVRCAQFNNFPTRLTPELISLFSRNYLFEESSWLKIDGKELLPNEWLLRHPYFYKTYQISHDGHQRKFKNYYTFLLDRNTGFISTKSEVNQQGNHVLFSIYDQHYLEGTECHHGIILKAESEHFIITQIKVVCR